MRNIYILTASIVLAIALSGCQQITEVEFYPPSKDNAEYSVRATKTTPGRGPIKSVKGKSGSPDFSDHKSFTLTFFNM